MKEQSEINGAAVSAYIKDNNLSVVEKRNWEIEYANPETGEKWLLDYPMGHMHGGGPPRLTRITEHKMKKDDPK